MLRERDQTACWDEATFWYLLAVESARALRMRRPFLVLVVDAQGTSDSSDVSNPSANGMLPGLTDALARCLRETDLVGWHRTGRTAGALLTQDAADDTSARLVGGKVLKSLQALLPGETARRLRLRIYRSGAPGARGGFDRIYTATVAGEMVAALDAVGAAVPDTAEATVPGPPQTPAPTSVEMPARPAPAQGLGELRAARRVAS